MSELEQAAKRIESAMVSEPISRALRHGRVTERDIELLLDYYLANQRMLDAVNAYNEKSDEDEQ
jgi:hypothetical protein